MAELSQDVINTIIAEAGGDGRKGMEAVAWAIANRAAKGNKTPEQVVKAKGQFEGYSNPGSGSRKAQQDPNMVAKAKDIWDKVQSGSIPDPLQGGTMFHASSISPYWADAENKHGTVKIGNQTYYLGGSALPPMNIPQVVSELDTKRPAPVPADKSPDMRMMTNPTMSAVAKALQVTPSNDVPLPRPRPSTAPQSIVSGSMDAVQRSNPRKNLIASDSLALDPIKGIAVPDLNAGRYTGPNFNTNYTRNDDPGFASTGATPYAPQPAIASEPFRAAQASGNAVDPGLQAALAAKMSQSPATRLVQSIPIKSSPPMSYAGQDASPQGNPDRLSASPTGLPAQYGSMSPQAVASIGFPLLNQVDAQGHRVTGENPILTAKVAPQPFSRPNFGMGGVDIDPKPRAAIFNVVPQQRANAAYGPMARIQRNPIFSLLGGNKSPIANAVASVLINGGNNTQRQSTQSILDTTDHINGRAYAGQDMRGLV